MVSVYFIVLLPVVIIIAPILIYSEYLHTYDKRFIVIRKTGQRKEIKLKQFLPRTRVNLDKNMPLEIEIRHENITLPAHHTFLGPNEAVIYKEGNVRPEDITEKKLIEANNVKDAESLIRLAVDAKDDPTRKAMLQKPMPIASMVIYCIFSMITGAFIAYLAVTGGK